MTMGTMARATATTPLASERQQRRLHPRETAAAIDPEREHIARDHVEPEHRDLVAIDREQADGDAGREPIEPRRPFERSRREPQRDREIGEADDLAGVLQARCRRGAERKDQSRHHGAAGMPGAIAEIHDEREAAGKEIGEGDEVGFAEGRRRRERRERKVQRREDQ